MLFARNIKSSTFQDVIELLIEAGYDIFASQESKDGPQVEADLVDIDSSVIMRLV